MDTLDNYDTYIIDNENFFKCKNCDFYTKHKYSMTRHFSGSKKCSLKTNVQCEFCHKEFRDIRDKQRHLSRKKKCSLIINEDIEQLENTEDEKKDISINHEIDTSNSTSGQTMPGSIEVNILKEKLNDARHEIDKLKKENKRLENDAINARINIFNLYSDGIVDKFKKKGNANNILYKYEIEYSILYNSLFKYKTGYLHPVSLPVSSGSTYGQALQGSAEINDSNKQKIKDKLFLLLDIVNDELLKSLVFELREHHKEYRPFIKEYRDMLLEKEKNGEKKINGRHISVYKVDLNRILEKE